MPSSHRKNRWGRIGTKAQKAEKRSVDRDEGEEECPLSLNRQLPDEAVLRKHRLPGLIDHVVRHRIHASPGEEHYVCVFGQMDSALTRHFPQHTFRSISLHGIAESSTHHDSNPVVGKRIRPMQEFKKLCANPGPFIEHSLKIRAIPENVSMPSHNVGKKPEVVTRRGECVPWPSAGPELYAHFSFGSVPRSRESVSVSYSMGCGM